MDIPETDQWKLEGDCTKCRRHNYCKKPCHRCKVAVRKMFTDSLISKINEKIPESNNDVNENSDAE